MTVAIGIGLSGLQVSQRAIDLVGQNIANTQTPGYHRQVANLAVRAIVGTGVGAGVEVDDVTRSRSNYVESALLGNASDIANLDAQTQNARHLESLIEPGDGAVHNQLEKVFNNLQQLASDPSNQAQRRVVLNTAVGLTNQSNDLAQFSEDLDQQGTDLVANANNLSQRIADLNLQIVRSDAQGINTNDVRDQRDQLISNLGQILDVRVIPQDYGAVNVLAGGYPVVVTSQALPLAYAVNTSNQGVVTPAGSPTQVLQPTSGQLTGVLQFRNTVVPDYQTRLDALANSLIQSVDQVQATGLGLKGPLSAANGVRDVSAVNVPLSSAGLAFPPQAGTLTVTTTAPNGTRSLTRVVIDPATQSLTGLASSLAIVPGLQAVLADPVSNTLKITASVGFHFDFSGRLSSVPDDLSAYSGTATLKLLGSYSGSTNDRYVYSVVGAGGTVGTTAGLSLQVTRQSDSAVIGTVDLGPGYTAGSATPAINGVQLQVGAGALNPGDTFGVDVTGNPDTAHILTALGVNTFFSGSGAGNVKVRPELLADPQLLGASANGSPGDNTNLQRLAALRDSPLLSGGTQTFRDFYATMVGDVGTQASDLSDRQTAATTLGQRLNAEQQSVSGVDTNEELVSLLKFQRSFQMSAKYLEVVNHSLDEIMKIVG
jgi:flagellar hook-associated protein 1 FlgK